MSEDELRAKHGAVLANMTDEDKTRIEDEVIELIVLAVRTMPVPVFRAAIGATLPDEYRPFIQDYLYSTALSDEIRKVLQ